MHLPRVMIFMTSKNYHVHPEITSLPFNTGFEDDLAVRAVKTMNDLAASAKLSPIFIVTHGGFLKNFFKALFPDKISGYAGTRTALNHLVYKNGTWNIISLNDDQHLHSDLSKYAHLDKG